MNPLTLVKRIQNINSKEAALGISEDASWHTKYKESAYVFVGGIPFDLTEGDLLAVFAQYGEIVDVNLVRDKGTGKSKGFAFIAYEDQRSTNLAVDNLNGAQILGRIIRVDHASNYKKKEEEDEEKEQQKREARGVCRAFQRGECNRGAACKFSHNEQRCANTGGGPEDSHSRWDHDKYDGSSKSHGRYGNISSSRIPESKVQEGGSRSRLYGDGARASRAEDDEREMKSHSKRSATSPGEQDKQGLEKQSERKEERRHREHHDRRETERALGRCEAETKPSKDHDRRREERSGRHELERNPREEDRDRRGDGKRSRYERDSYSHRHREDDKEHHRSSHR